VEGATGRPPLLAPQANVMATIVQGVMNQNLPWAPILVGAMIAFAVELLGISSLPFAIGLYLPLSLSTPIMTGGVVALIVRKMSREKEHKANNERGVLFASGLVAGDALIGVAVAFMMLWPTYAGFYDAHEGMWNTVTGSVGPYLSLVMFALVALVLWNRAARNFKK